MKSHLKKLKNKNVAKKAYNLIKKILKNCIENDDEKFRILKTSNKILKKKLF